MTPHSETIIYPVPTLRRTRDSRDTADREVGTRPQGEARKPGAMVSCHPSQLHNGTEFDQCITRRHSAQLCPARVAVIFPPSRGICVWYGPGLPSVWSTIHTIPDRNIGRRFHVSLVCPIPIHHSRLDCCLDSYRPAHHCLSLTLNVTSSKAPRDCGLRTETEH
ncbi:hypothetical protein ASPCADRAFT_129682 [Aspergillus carbonarius ITEM 5010]|uniref:Uncharacterized protein n=1 Tax=Aspergillus carbonarius (strain ITEM 5010) TaxID=602072 RepID=A0A1R3RQ43_ASPC5|nr:hypothetical protein ASPCADRAFT_129682 [Aspergillus carbonarius ITEM 5010]